MQRGTTSRFPSAVSQYPDVLGFISGDARLTVDSVQAALGVYPKRIAVGQSFELLILLQNICDHSITTKVVVQLPHRNPSGERLSLFAARDTLDISMATGEVGLLHVPVRPQLPTPVGQNYPLAVRIDAVRPRGSKLVRDPSGGRAPGVFNMSVHRLEILQHEVGFAANLGTPAPSANTMIATFDILPGQILQPTADSTPRYEILWDAKQLAQDQITYPEIEAKTRELVQGFTRAPLYEALQNETKSRFAEIGMALLPGEILAIAKIMTYTMEDGLDLEPGFNLVGSSWFQRLTLFRTDTDLLSNMDRLVSRLYTATIGDAARLGYTLLAQHLGQPSTSNIPMIKPNRVTKPLQNPLGLLEDQTNHIIEIHEALDRLVPIDLTHVYWPLVLAGALLHVNIRGPKENLWETLDELRTAWQSRNVTKLPNAITISNVMTDTLHNTEQILTRMRLSRS